MREHWWQLWRPKVPPPGSQTAARAGCVCPVNQNNMGLKKPKQGWVVRSICELHGQMDTRHTQ